MHFIKFLCRSNLKLISVNKIPISRVNQKENKWYYGINLPTFLPHALVIFYVLSYSKLLCTSLLSHWELLLTRCLYNDMQPLISGEVIQDLWFWNEAPANTINLYIKSDFAVPD